MGSRVNVRSAARVLLLNPALGLFLLKAVDRDSNDHWWVAPGGGLEEGETFEAAARRELLEETGIEAAVSRCVWKRRHAYVLAGAQVEQRERFFVAHTNESRISPPKHDSYVVGHRWWTVEAICESRDDFAPSRLGALLPSIVSGRYPRTPIDCGV